MSYSDYRGRLPLVSRTHCRMISIRWLLDGGLEWLEPDWGQASLIHTNLSLSTNPIASPIQRSSSKRATNLCFSPAQLLQVRHKPFVLVRCHENMASVGKVNSVMSQIGSARICHQGDGKAHVMGTLTLRALVYRYLWASVGDCVGLD